MRLSLRIVRVADRGRRSSPLFLRWLADDLEIGAARPAAAAGRLCGISLRSTSSRGPKPRCWPLSSTSTLSQTRKRRTPVRDHDDDGAAQLAAA